MRHSHDFATGSASDMCLNDLILLWRGSSEREPSADWLSRNPRVRHRYSWRLNGIAELCGDMPLALFEDVRARGLIHHWRNQLGDKPAASRELLCIMRMLFEFGRKMGLVGRNPAKGIKPPRGCANRYAHVFWTDEDLERCDEVARHMNLAPVAKGLRLMALTGLMPGRARILTSEHVVGHSLERPFHPEDRQRGLPTLPLLPEARQLIYELEQQPRKAGIENLLVTDRGLPWKRSNFSRALKKLRDGAGIVHVSYTTGSPVILDKQPKDLPKTWAIRLMERGASDDEIFSLTRWLRDDIRELRTLAGLSAPKDLNHLSWPSASSGSADATCEEGTATPNAQLNLFSPKQPPSAEHA